MSFLCGLLACFDRVRRIRFIPGVDGVKVYLTVDEGKKLLVVLNKWLSIQMENGTFQPTSLLSVTEYTDFELYHRLT